MKKLLLFIYLAVFAAATYGQTIQSVRPDIGQPGQTGLYVTISGSGSDFYQATSTSVTFTNGSTSFSGYNVYLTSATTFGAFIDIPSNATLGEYSVVVNSDINYPVLNNAFFVGNAPTVSLTGGGAVCNNTTVSLNPTVSGGFPPYTYRWSSWGGSLSCTTCTSPTNTITSTLDSVILVVTDSRGFVTTTALAYTAPPSINQDICIVSVDSATGKNIVIWNNPNNVGIDSFIIFKETTTLNVFAEAGAVAGGDFSTFIDLGSNPLEHADRYTIAILDTCGGVEAQSAAHQTMHLSISPGVGSTWNLNWNAYEGFSYNTYYIYRNSGSGLQLIDSISSSSTSYTDLTPPSGTLFYQIRIVNLAGCSPSRSASPYSESHSNVISTNGTTAIASVTADELNAYTYSSEGRNYIHVSFDQSAGYALKLYDISGKLVMDIPNSSATEVTAPFSLATGVYVLELKSGETTTHTKVFIR